MRYIIIMLLVAFCVVPMQSYGQLATGVLKESKVVAEKDSVSCFPLQADTRYSLYSYIIDLKRLDVKRKYEHLFARYHYDFTGYVWEGILRSILDDAPDKALSRNVFVKSYPDLVGFTITRHRLVGELPVYLCPILSDTKRFEKYIKNADRSQINNY